MIDRHWNFKLLKKDTVAVTPGAEACRSYGEAWTFHSCLVANTMRRHVWILYAMLTFVQRNWFALKLMSAADSLVSGRGCVDNWDPPHENSSVYYVFYVNVVYLHTHTLVTWPWVCEILPWPLMESSMVVAQWTDHTRTHFHPQLWPLRLTQPSRNVVIGEKAGSPAAMFGATLSINSFTVEQEHYMRNRSAFNWSCGERPDTGSVRRAVCVTSWLN